MKEMRNQIKAELSKQQYVLEQWKNNYKKQQLQSTLQQIRYVEGIIAGLEKSIKTIDRFIENN